MTDLEERVNSVTQRILHGHASMFETVALIKELWDRVREQEAESNG